MTFTCCGKTFATPLALSHHVRDSAIHASQAAAAASPLSTATRGTISASGALRSESATKDQPSRPRDQCVTVTESPSSTSSPPRPIEAVKARHRPVSFVKEGQHIKAKRRDKMRRDGSPHCSVHSGSGRRYSDVGDNHALCDKDCGWCGHCADEAGI